MNISLGKMELSDLDNMDLKAFDEFWSENILREELSCPTSYYIFAKTNDNIMGFAGIKFLLDEAHITNIATRIDKRNEGIRFKTFRSINNESKRIIYFNYLRG